MRQIFLDRGEACIKKVAYPQVEPHTVLVAVHYSLVGSGKECAALVKGQPTFLEIIPRKVKKVLSCVISQGLEDAAQCIKDRYAQQYSTVGSSCTGRVVATGDQIKSVRVGDWVACFGQEYAYYADIISVPQHCLVKLENKELLKIGSLTGYGARAMHMIRQSSIELGEIVAVVIHDLLGLLVAHLCVKNGAQVIGICETLDLFQYAQKYNFAHLFLMQDSSLIYSIELITGNNGVDALFIPSISIKKLLFEPAHIVRRKGRIVVGSELNIVYNSSIILHKEIKICFASTYGAGTDEAEYERGTDFPVAHVRWTQQRNAQAFVRLLTEKNWCEDVYDFPEFAIEEIAHKKNIQITHPLLGIYLRYTTGPHDTRALSLTPAVLLPEDKERGIPTFLPARKTTFNVGIIGAPKLGRPAFFEDLMMLRNVRIVAISDENNVDAVNLGQKCGVDRIYNSIEELLVQESVDVIMVTSVYAKRASNSLKALRAGKAVYVERPLATSFEDFSILDSALIHNNRLPLCADDYRLYSPLMIRVQEIIENRKAPMIINYRMNVGGISKEELIQIDRGAGRIINDAAHILHLFCVLTQAQPVTVSVEALHGVCYSLFPTDNFVAAITFSDGSLCNLVYTVLGNTTMGNERMEVFVDGKSIILDDYNGLYGFGTPSWFNMTLAQSDKGHKALLKTFFKDLKNGTHNSFVSWNYLRQSTRLTLLVDQLACQGGGDIVYK